MLRNLSFTAWSPHTGKCLCRTQPSPEGGGKGRHYSLEGGERLGPGSWGFIYTRARQCPQAHPSTSSWPASASPAQPLLCLESKLMQYRSSILSNVLNLSSPILASPIIHAQAHLRRPQIPGSLDLIFFFFLLNANQSQDLPQQSRGPGWLPSP